MKRKSFTLIVLKKELTEIIRDRRSLFTMILLPFLLYPLMFGVIGRVIEKTQNDVLYGTTVAFMGESADAAEELLSAALIESGDIETLSFDDPVQALKDGMVRMLILAEGSSPIELTIVFNTGKTASVGGADYAAMLINAFNAASAEAQLLEKGIVYSELSPTSVTSMDMDTYIEQTTGVRPSSSSGGLMLSMLLPYVLIMMLATSGMGAANSMFTGEKERKTFSPLLSTLAGRYPVLLGKYIAVNVLGLFTVLVTMSGMFAGIAMNPAVVMAQGMGGTGFDFPILMLLFSILLVILLSMLFSGIHVAISTWARTTREAASTSSFIMIASMVVSVMTMYLQTDDITVWMMTIPVLNVICTLKFVLVGAQRYGMMAIAIASSVVFLVAVLSFTLNLFKKEHVMFRA